MSTDPVGTAESAAGRALVVGLGLIGTSIALNLSRAGWLVSGVDCDRARAARARELGAIDTIGSDRRAQVAFVATPVSAIASIVAGLFAESEVPDLVVSDVGGVKGPIVSAVREERFVGGHPMAGSEQEGPDGASTDLFVGATWVLTPTERTDPGAFALVRSLVSGFGSEVVALHPERHDALVAVVSHLPHLTAANLMVLAADATDEHHALLRLAAGGFRDMTRIAAGDPAIWPDIFQDNADAVLLVLDDLIERLRTARRIVAEGDREALVELLERAKAARRNLPPRIATPGAVVEFRIPVPDRPGVIAEVTTVLGSLGVNIFDFEIAHSAEGTAGVLLLVIEGDDVEKAKAALSERGFHPATGKRL